MTVATVTGTAFAQSAAAPATRPSAGDDRRAVIIVLDGDIDDLARDSLFKRFDEARELGASTVILKLNTPGGLVTSSLDIAGYLKRLNPDDLRVIAFVENEAVSGGTMVALAAHEIVMQPASMIGLAAPISVAPGGRLLSIGGAERAKIESPIIEDFRDSAVRRGYDPLLAEAMVSYTRVVHWIENPATGERRIVNADDYKSLTSGADAAWRSVPGVRNPLDGPDELLTLHEDLAVRLGLASGIAGSAEELAASRGLDVIATLTPSRGDRAVALLTSTPVRFVLTVVMLFTLFFAFSHPGHGMAEALAMIALGALVGVPLLTGYAQWWEIVAVLVGLALVALEVFVIPGFGFAGISGIILLLFGLTMTFVPAEPALPGFLPSLAGTWDALWNGLMVVTIGLLCSLLLWVWLSRYLPKIPYVNRLILTAVAGGPGAGAVIRPPDVPSDGPVIGEMGLAVTDLRPSGSVRFQGDGEIASVISDSGYVPKGTKVVVFDTTENRIVVRPVAS